MLLINTIIQNVRKRKKYIKMFKNEYNLYNEYDRLCKRGVGKGDARFLFDAISLMLQKEIVSI